MEMSRVVVVVDAGSEAWRQFSKLINAFDAMKQKQSRLGGRVAQRARNNM
jgi:hypothetical protein